MKFLRLCALLAIVLGIVACSTTRPWSNEPLGAQEAVQYDGLAQLFDFSRLPDLLVVVTFSGGGSSAAAFAHAVLSELDAVPFVWRGASRAAWHPRTSGALLRGLSGC